MVALALLVLMALQAWSRRVCGESGFESVNRKERIVVEQDRYGSYRLSNDAYEALGGINTYHRMQISRKGDVWRFKGAGPKETSYKIDWVGGCQFWCRAFSDAANGRESIKGRRVGYQTIEFDLSDPHSVRGGVPQ